MIVCILWQHRLAVRHVCSQRGLFFAVEADGVLAITQKGEGWQVQLSETLQFLDSSRRCRLIKGRHLSLIHIYAAYGRLHCGRRLLRQGQKDDRRPRP